jgi:hypothetical protein
MRYFLIDCQNHYHFFWKIPNVYLFAYFSNNTGLDLKHYYKIKDFFIIVVCLTVQINNVNFICYYQFFQIMTNTYISLIIFQWNYSPHLIHSIMKINLVHHLFIFYYYLNNFHHKIIEYLFANSHHLFLLYLEYDEVVGKVSVLWFLFLIDVIWRYCGIDMMYLFFCLNLSIYSKYFLQHIWNYWNLCFFNYQTFMLNMLYAYFIFLDQFLWTLFFCN